MLALVTGATGAVGSAVAARLAGEGYRVRATVRGSAPPGIDESVVAPMEDAAALRAAAVGADLAVHCAAVVSGDLAESRRVNVEGARNLVDALVAGGCRLLIHISTISVYDDAGAPDFDEDSPLWRTPDYAYGFTKAEAERIVGGASGRGLASVILRPAMVLSLHPRSRWGPLAVARARATDGCLLPFPELPYVHADALGDAVVLAARTPAARGRAYNAVEGVADTRTYLAAIYAAAGLPVPEIPGDAPRLRFASDRIREQLGWAPPDRWPAFRDALSGVR